jgi:hypothetical protein
MHKAIGGLIKKEMGEGEKKAPIKSIKLKVKFQKSKGGVLDSKKKGSRE